jgi:hypothetical protein
LAFAIDNVVDLLDTAFAHIVKFTDIGQAIWVVSGIDQVLSLLASKISGSLSKDDDALLVAAVVTLETTKQASNVMNLFIWKLLELLIKFRG